MVEGRLSLVLCRSRLKSYAKTAVIAAGVTVVTDGLVHRAGEEIWQTTSSTLRCLPKFTNNLVVKAAFNCWPVQGSDRVPKYPNAAGAAKTLTHFQLFIHSSISPMEAKIV